MNFRLILLTILLLGTKLIAQAHSVEVKPVWNLNDVTFLFPLPSLSGNDWGFKASDNLLLPPAIYNKLPSPVVSTLPKEQWFKDFRVVGVRIDPEALQVRMVWQITHLNAEKTAYTTEDSGIHTFYSLTEKQMKHLLAGLWKLKLQGLAQVPAINTDLLPLGVHPGFSHSSFASRFAQSLRSLILAPCSSKNLIQATLMQFGVPANGWWEFSGFNKDKSGQWNAISIPRVNDVIQKFSNETTLMDRTNTFPVDMKGEIVPFPEGEHLNDGIHAYHPPNESDRPVFEKTFRLVRTFQNPKLTNADMLDCVQCHLTDSTTFWMNSNLKDVEKPGLTDDVRLQNPNSKLHDLSNTTATPQSTKIFRALGYWQSFPAVNQRVINETALVADYLNQKATK